MNWRLVYLSILLTEVTLLADAQNQVLDLSNDDAYLDLGTGSVLKPTEAITVMFWMYHDDWQSVDNKPTLLGNTQHVGYAIAFTSDQLQVWISRDSVYKNVKYPTAHLSAGWHHVAFTYSGLEIKLALDGLMVDQMAFAQKAPLMQPDSTISMMIGAETRYNSQPHPGLFFNGLMDEIIISSEAVELETIRKYYAGDFSESAEAVLLNLNFEGERPFTDQSIYSNPVEQVNEPLLRQKELPLRILIKYEFWHFVLLLIIAVAGGIWYLTKANTDSFKWVMAFWIVQVSLLLLASPVMHSWISHDRLPDFWNVRLADFVFVGSLSILAKAIYEAFSHKSASWAWMFLGFAALGVLLLPIDLRQNVVLVISFLTVLGIYTLALLESRLPLLWLVGGLLVGSICIALEMMGFLHFYAFTPVNNILSFVLLGIGLFHLLQDKEEPTPQLSNQLLEILSNKESEVFDLLVSGKTDAEIAEQLTISTNTVKTYNKRIYAKLGVKGRRELVSFVEE